MENRGKEHRPIRLVCKCGYRKKLPEKFAGKRIVCPKCSSVLRVERLKKLAKLLVRCPWCNDLSELNVNRQTCENCNRKYDFPVSFGGANNSPGNSAIRQSDSAPIKIDEEGREIEVTPSGPAVATDLSSYMSRKRRSNFLAWLTVLVWLGLISAIGYLLLDKYGEEIGFREPAKPEVVKPLVNDVQVVADEAKDAENALLPAPEVKPELPPLPPKISSPAVAIVTIEKDIGPAIDKETDEFKGNKLFVEFQIQNLSPCSITKVEAIVQLRNGPVWKREIEQTFELKRPIDPGETRFIPSALPVQKCTAAKVTITSAWANDQVDETKVVKEVTF